MNAITVSNLNRTINGHVNLPSSKSISNRILIIKAFISDNIEIQNLSQADDTILMKQLFDKISSTKTITKEIQLNCKNAGTVFRFLTAYLAITQGKWFLTGSKRMEQRPISILVDSLNKIGAKINYKKKPGYPPLYIEGRKIDGGMIEVDSSISSQFISALLLIAPVLPKGLTILLKNRISSLPYIEMTIGILKYFGIKVEFENNKININNQIFRKKNIVIEPDWTSASYWYEMAALSYNADITLLGLKKESLQGDSILPDIYKNLGVKTIFTNNGVILKKDYDIVSHFKFDFTNNPDIAQSVIVTCAALNIPSEFSGLESLKIKETDRLVALQNELMKLGFDVEVFGKSEFKIRKLEFQSRNFKSKMINTYSDHRMAMAFAPLALHFKEIQIENPGIVSKSYPGFWADLEKLSFGLNIRDI